MEHPRDALRALAEQLRDERSVIAEHVLDPGDAAPALGVLAASGPRTAAAGGEYAVVVEAVREGYLLHHAEPRLLAAADPDLALLAGDYLYALGIERLGLLGDLDAVRELADLISTAAELHSQGRGDEPAEALWLASSVAIACGVTPGHADGKAALREARSGAAAELIRNARSTAERAGIGEALDAAAEAIDFGARRG
ncbi:MAG TPA: hypothetical protein VK919_11280 [Solirubrobacterales bacterium]|nr:hypothetical protein [Solirubrobacterales bacterium]